MGHGMTGKFIAAVCKCCQFFPGNAIRLVSGSCSSGLKCEGTLPDSGICIVNYLVSL